MRGEDEEDAQRPRRLLALDPAARGPTAGLRAVRSTLLLARRSRKSPFQAYAYRRAESSHLAVPPHTVSPAHSFYLRRS